MLQPQCKDNLFPLPEVRENGFVFGLANRSTQSLSWNIYSPVQSSVTLIGQTQGKVYYSQTLNLKKGNNKVDVKTDSFPLGVAVFTLFDAELKKQCERLVFVNPENGLKIKLETDKEFYNPKEEVKLTVHTLDKNNKRKQTTVYLIEDGTKRRVAETKTTPEGQFAFHNIDLSGNVYIITKRPNKINLFESKPQIIAENADFYPLNLAKERITENNIVEEEKKEVAPIIKDGELAKNEEIIIPDFPDWDDNKALDEVVVAGYATTKKQSITGAVTSIRQDEIRVQVNNIKNALTGKIPGLLIDPSNLNNTQGNKMYLKGVSSLGSGYSQPTIVLNGILLSETISGVYNINDYVNIQDIESVTITKTPIDDIFVSKTGNGVIFITTKNPVFTNYKSPKPKYTGVSIPKRKFYASQTFEQKNHNQDNLATTVYWNGDVTTDKEGKATLSFTNNDTSSSFRITAEGFSNTTGLIGSHYHNIATTKPFSLDVKTPIFASIGDVVKLPVMVNNNTSEEVTAKVKLSLPQELIAVGNQEIEVKIAPKTAETIFLSFSPTKEKGEHKYTISANTANTSDEITRSVTVRTVYFPRKMSFSGRSLKDVFNFSLKGQMVEGSFHANLVCYTNTIDELFSGLESIFREPYGCFEQTSSSNFPNIMALQALEASGEDKPEIKKKALDYLDKGYQKLSSYEIKSTGGFEWFGNDPAHTGLTAYGILQFHEMQKVYDKVDKAMVDRARNFIKSRKDGSGHFLNNTRGMDSFAGSPQSISDAYITYAFSETGETDDITKEYAKALDEAYESKDMYRMALMANSAFNMKDMKNHNKLIEYFKDNMKKGWDKMKIETTITRSSLPSATQETVALWALAMLKSNDPFNFPIIDTCINYISSKRSNGGFYNTQATILSLQAITKYAESGSKALDYGSLAIQVNDTKKASLDLTKPVEEGKEMNLDITDLFNPKGDNQIKLYYENMEKGLPYTVDLYWEYDRPESSEECAVYLTTKLNSNTVKRNETVRLSITLENKKSEGIPMNVAIIGIPGGMSLQPWQLKELRDKLVFDYYEIIDDNLVIYYSHMQPNEKKEINLDLKAEIPGTYKGMASSAYVYYTNEHKHWVDGISVTITE